MTAGEMFQSTRPRGREPGCGKVGVSPAGFNPRALAGANNFFERYPIALARFQSTRPRGRELAEYGYSDDHITVSIHAPSRARTLRAYRSTLTRYSFNPRALAGANRDMQAGQPQSEGFNPRALAGANRQWPGCNCGGCVSIHAPSRARTRRLGTVAWTQL